MMTLSEFIEIHIASQLNYRELKALEFRQRDVLGFGENAHSLTALGREFGVSKERARQIRGYVRAKVQRIIARLSFSVSEPSVLVLKEDRKDTTLPMKPVYVTDLGELPIRAVNCLRHANLLLLDDLVEVRPYQLLRYPNFGHKSLAAVRDLLAGHGLYLKGSQRHG